MNARRSISWRRTSSLAAILAAALGAIQAHADSPNRDRLARGQELFVREWSPRDEKSPKGDGLGPLYNADSCVACHAQGGTGGAGPKSVNVQLLTLTGTSTPSAQVHAMRAPLDRIHPAFFSRGVLNTTIVLHRQSTDRGYDVWREDLLRMKSDGGQGLDPLLRLFPVQALSLFLPPRRQPSPNSVSLAIDGLEFEITERNTPALFGAALINSVTPKLLGHLAQRQAEQFPGITGRVPRSIDGGVGRFGWRGQVSTVQDFVQNACAVELGLQLPGRPQAASPIAQAEILANFDTPSEKRPVQAHADMEPGQVRDLIAYVTSLPRPQQARPKLGGSLALSHVTGEKIFHSVGCASCHMRRVGKIDRIYSDLLLHDMGPDLSDAAPAIPDGGSSSHSGGYGGGSVLPGVPITSSLAELRREWRTPPLWGVRDSAPYLHDGRAATLEEAIRGHGGEAESAVEKFRALTAMERDSLLTFLDTLAAP